MSGSQGYDFLSGHRTCLRCSLALLYAAAGVLHLVEPAPFLSITPGWVPAPAAVIFATGLFEVAAALGLLLQSFRKLAGILLALYAIFVFPANIVHALRDLGPGSSEDSLGWWYHAPRLLLQPVLVWAALYATSLVSWPLSQRSDAGPG